MKSTRAAVFRRSAVDAISRAVAAFAVAVLGTTVHASSDELGPDAWPTTVEAAVADVLGHLSIEDRKTIRNTRREDLIQFHPGWGTGIRNRYGLWRGNASLIRSACGEPCHPDDASLIIIEKAWEALQN